MDSSTTPSAASFLHTSYTGSLSGREVTISLAGNTILIEAETTDSHDVHTVTLANDDLQGPMMKHMFRDMSRLYRILAKALENAPQGSDLSLSDQMLLSYPLILEIDGEKTTHVVSVQLDTRLLSREAQLERGLNKANKYIHELKSEVKMMFALVQELKTDRQTFQDLYQSEVKKLSALVQNSIVDNYSTRQDLYRPMNTMKFETNCNNKDLLTFSNADLTATVKPSGWYAVHTTEALPTSGRCRFSVMINKISKKQHIMIGVAHETQRDPQNCYSAKGSYFCHLANQYLYYDKSVTKTSKVKSFASSDLITVFVDLDNELVIFYIGEERMSHIKTNFAAFDKKGFYPCVHLYTAKDSVTLKDV